MEGTLVLRLIHSEIAVAGDKREPSLLHDVLKVQRHEWSVGQRLQVVDQLEAIARHGYLSSILLPDLAVAIFTNTADHLAHERAVPLDLASD